MLLLLRHSGNILGDAYIFILLKAAEDKEILKLILVYAEVGNDAVFKLKSEGGEEFFVFFSVGAHKLFKLGFYLFLDSVCDGL